MRRPQRRVFELEFGGLVLFWFVVGWKIFPADSGKPQILSLRSFDRELQAVIVGVAVRRP
jgi:hypothetical protein